MSDLKALKLKLEKRIVHSIGRSEEYLEKLSGLTPTEISSRYNYWGGRTHGFLAGRLEGLRKALDLIEDIECDTRDDEYEEELEANPHLIKAAPKMYRLLEDISRSDCRTGEFYREIVELLAEAIGEEV